MSRRKKPINKWSVQDHQDYLLTGYSDRQLDFCLLPRRTVCCAAFIALSPAASKVLIMALNEVSWTKRKARRENGRKIAACAVAKPFYLPYGRLEAVGLNRHTVSRAIRELILLGFIRIKTAIYGRANLYELSDEYQTLNTSEVAKLTGAKNALVKDGF